MHVYQGVILWLITILLSQQVTAQTINDLEFGDDEHLEVVTWNIEWFPKNGQTTIEYLVPIIEALDVDIIAIQEVNDIEAFEELVAYLNEYDGYLESLYFGGLAYLYKSEYINVVATYEIYTTEPFWNFFPRSPQVMEFTYRGNPFVIINNHLKCCGDGFLDTEDEYDEETRRLMAINLLKDYIDTNFDTDRVFLVGDLNDILTDTYSNNVFNSILEDTENYIFADMAIAEGPSENWSFPNWPSHLDHICITNELFEAFYQNSEIQTIKIDDYLAGGWWEYDANISDHLPVGLKLHIQENLAYSEFTKPSTFVAYPNPSKHLVYFNFIDSFTNAEIYISDVRGSSIKKLIVDATNKITWNVSNIPNGIYFATLKTPNSAPETLKIIVSK